MTACAPPSAPRRAATLSRSWRSSTLSRSRSPSACAVRRAATTVRIIWGRRSGRAGRAAHVALAEEVLGVAGAAEDLDGVGDDPHRRLGADAYGDSARALYAMSSGASRVANTDSTTVSMIDPTVTLCVFRAAELVSFAGALPFRGALSRLGGTWRCSPDLSVCRYPALLDRDSQPEP